MIRQRILVAADHPITGLSEIAMLRDLGYEVTSWCISGQSAVSMVGEGKPDAVLMDIMLSGDMKGTEAAKVIREKFGTPIVFVTACGAKDASESAVPTEGYGYVVKPFTKADLPAAIEGVIARA